LLYFFHVKNIFFNKNKRILLVIHTKGFNLKKLNEVQGKEQYRAEVSNRSAALEDLDTEVEINSAWE
jgi:hypothetical protein